MKFVKLSKLKDIDVSVEYLNIDKIVSIEYLGKSKINNISSSELMFSKCSILSDKGEDIYLVNENKLLKGICELVNSTDFIKDLECEEEGIEMYKKQ
tara:strand:+ start:203 stop:493 length:291 start_codon:yes stop_codon:yes gene_type:complete